MACDQEDFEIVKGATFRKVIRWETTPIVYKAITGITAAAPAVVTCASHGVPDGWKVAIVTTDGMRELRAKHNPPRDGEYHRATVLSAGSLELNDVNSTDYEAYVSGGYVQYFTPQDLAGYDARMTIKDVAGGTILMTLTSAGLDGRITIDNAAKTITIEVSADDTAAIDWVAGVYDFEMEDGAGVVTHLLHGNISVTEEITT